jgi:cellulose biosynthesis protein BcsQ
MLAVAMMNDLMYGNRSILLQTQFEMNQLEIPLLSESKREQIRNYNIGVDRLIQGIRSGMNAKQLLTSSCITLSKQCIDFLPSTNSQHREIYEKEIKDNFKEILGLAEACYELVFIDASAGMNDFIEMVWEEADLIIVNLSQNKRVLEDFFMRYDVNYEKMLFLIGNYDANSEWNVKNILKRIKDMKKDLTFTIPYNTQFRDAASCAQLTEFFLQNLGCEKDDDNYEFIKELTKLTHKLQNISEEYMQRPKSSTQRRPMIGGMSCDY